jgi:hypothetical protein
VVRGLNDPRSRRAFRDGAVHDVVAKRRSKSAAYLVRELHRALRRSGLFPHQKSGHVAVPDHGGAKYPFSYCRRYAASPLSSSVP